MIYRAIAVCGLLWSSAGMAAAELRSPTGKWVVDFADAQCVASRNYGSEKEPLYLVLKSPALGDVLQIGIIRQGSLAEPMQVEGSIRFDGSRAIRTNLLEYGANKVGQQALLVNLPADQQGPLRAAKSMRIHSGGEGAVTRSKAVASGPHTDETFALSQIPQLLTMMDTCVADLRKFWNVHDGPGLAPTLKEGPRGDLASLFSPDDYPGIAAFKSQMGTLQMVLLIDEAGKVADCTVIETSRIASLDAQSCIIVRQRAKFSPAVGLDGKPAKSAFRQRITWRLE